ncbi:MAG: hypothetical protein ACK4RN_13270 [Pseudorhodobacter sp.]
MSLRISDCGREPGFAGAQAGASLDALLREHALDLTLHLSDATEVPPDLWGEATMRNAAHAVIRIGAVLERRGRYAGFAVEPAQSEARKGVIHPMMTDHLEAQAVALAFVRDPDSPALHAEMLRLTSRARRLLESLDERQAQFGARSLFGNRPEFLVRIVNKRPLFAHSPEGNSRDKEKPHLILWPRAKPPATERPVGVFLHLYYTDYTDAAPVFAERLGRIAVSYE